MILILVSVAGAAPFAYVTGAGIDTGTVYVIDTASNNVTAVVPVGGWPRDVQSPCRNKGICDKPVRHRTTVSVIDTATNTVSATVDVGGIILGESQLTRQEQGFM